MGAGKEKVLRHCTLGAASIPNYALRNSTLAYSVYSKIDEKFGFVFGLGIRWRALGWRVVRRRGG